MFYSGGTVIIDHGHGLSSSFLHLSKVHVKVGQSVEQGDLIAEVGATGRATGPHLDWRMNWFDQRVDPEFLVGPMPEQ
jgi:murein DD-endopeptidase MepM/ murein hydrolase activator NlpD